jgi:O-antigen/teichoic acid export membrane protein
VADARLRRDIAWNLIPVGLLAIVGLGLNFLVAGWWGAGALGIFNLVTIAYFVLAVAGACGIQYSVLRAVAEAENDRDRIASIVVGALIPNVVLAIAATMIFVASRNALADLFNHPEVADGMLWAAPGLFCFAINKVMIGIVNGMRRMRALAIYTSLRYILIAGGLGLAHATGLASAHLAGIWSFVEGVMLIVLAGEVIATVALRRASEWRRWMSEHLDYGVRGLPATLAYEVNTKLDVWMVGAAGFTKEAVGIYSLAAAINEGATQLAVIVQNNVNPILAASFAAGRPEEVSGLISRTRRWFVPAFVAACALGAVAFPLIIPRLVSDLTFAAGAQPFAILMIGLALASPYLPFTQLLLMAGRPGWHTVYMVIVVGTNFVANRLLVPHFGLSGAAAATSIAVISSAVLIRAFARGKVGVQC